MKIAKSVNRLGTEAVYNIFAKTKKLAKQGKKIIDLSLGQSDFKSPNHVVEAAIQALKDGHHGYTLPNGMIECRVAVSRKIKNLYNGTLNKIPPYEALKQQYNLTDDQIAYIGDDIIDIPVMELAGVPIATDNAVPATKEVAVYVTQNGGGYGAFREAVEWLLTEQGRLTEVIDLLREKVQNQK